MIDDEASGWSILEWQRRLEMLDRATAHGGGFIVVRSSDGAAHAPN